MTVSSLALVRPTLSLLARFSRLEPMLGGWHSEKKNGFSFKVSSCSASVFMLSRITKNYLTCLTRFSLLIPRNFGMWWTNTLLISKCPLGGRTMYQSWLTVNRADISFTVWCRSNCPLSWAACCGWPSTTQIHVDLLSDLVYLSLPQRIWNLISVTVLSHNTMRVITHDWV